MSRSKRTTRKATTERPELAAIIRSTLTCRKELIQLDPWIPFPQNSCCFEFGPPGGRPRAPLFNALTRLGATDLPDPRWVKGSDTPAVRLTVDAAELAEAFRAHDAKVARKDKSTS